MKGSALRKTLTAKTGMCGVDKSRGGHKRTVGNKFGINQSITCIIHLASKSIFSHGPQGVESVGAAWNVTHFCSQRLRLPAAFARSTRFLHGCGDEKNGILYYRFDEQDGIPPV